MAAAATALPLKMMYNEMSEADKNAVIELAQNSLRAQEKSERTLYYKDFAQMVKQDLDATKGGKWNVIVGRSFGSFVAHETHTMIYFFLGNTAFMIWKHG